MGLIDATGLFRTNLPRALLNRAAGRTVETEEEVFRASCETSAANTPYKWPNREAAPICRIVSQNNGPLTIMQIISFSSARVVIVDQSRDE